MCKTSHRNGTASRRQWRRVTPLDVGLCSVHTPLLRNIICHQHARHRFQTTSPIPMCFFLFETTSHEHPFRSVQLSNDHLDSSGNFLPPSRSTQDGSLLGSNAPRVCLVHFSAATCTMTRSPVWNARRLQFLPVRLVSIVRPSFPVCVFLFKSTTYVGNLESTAGLLAIRVTN